MQPIYNNYTIWYIYSISKCRQLQPKNVALVRDIFSIQLLLLHLLFLDAPLTPSCRQLSEELRILGNALRVMPHIHIFIQSVYEIFRQVILVLLGLCAVAVVVIELTINACVCVCLFMPTTANYSHACSAHGTASSFVPKVISMCVRRPLFVQHACM